MANEPNNPRRPLEDIRVEQARRMYRDYQADDNQMARAPYWLGRFEVVLESLLAYVDQQAPRS
jgi:hypothetical protein